MMKNKLYKLCLFAYKLGILRGLLIVTKMFLGKREKKIYIRLKDISYPIVLRCQTSDEYTFQQIFVEKQYGFQYSGNPKTIIDAGANIGLAAVYFANRFPNAKIFCIEPEKENFDILRENTSPYPQITIINKGLWGKDAWLKVTNNNLDNWGFIVEECDSSEKNATQAISIPGLCREFQLKNIEIVKMDVEGSEKNILMNASEWLPNCEILVIELHDRMNPGTSEVFFRSMLKFTPFRIDIKGENIVCRFLRQTQHPGN